jgi:DNA-binding NarL/FixJ family response regulator
MVVVVADDHLGVRKAVCALTLTRVLVVDDFENWRRQVRLVLQARPAWQVVAEASDGSEAVQKAEDLKPDLILLDIGLPKLNGIETARRIRQRSPSSKIIFLSQNNNLDFVRAALGTGALGYVLKTDAGRELLPAVDAVLGGMQFFSSSVKGHQFTDTPEKAAHRHEVQFYSDEALLLDTFARFIAVALKSGRAAESDIFESACQLLQSEHRCFRRLVLGLIRSACSSAFLFAAEPQKLMVAPIGARANGGCDSADVHTLKLNYGHRSESRSRPQEGHLRPVIFRQVGSC